MNVAIELLDVSGSVCDGDAIFIGQRPDFTHVVFHYLGHGWNQEIHNVLCQGVDHKGDPLAEENRIGSV